MFIATYYYLILQIETTIKEELDLNKLKSAPNKTKHSNRNQKHKDCCEIFTKYVLTKGLIVEQINPTNK